jgi:hypothetical protein
MQNDLKEYIITKIYLHNYKNLLDYNLWTVFKEEFKNFTAKNFNQLCVITRTVLRTYLLRQDIYIKKHNIKRYISDVLFSFL